LLSANNNENNSEFFWVPLRARRGPGKFALQFQHVACRLPNFTRKRNNEFFEMTTKLAHREQQVIASEQQTAQGMRLR
jgi:hypothetical protein